MKISSDSIGLGQAFNLMMIYLGGDQIGSTLDFNPFSIVHEKHREMGIINDDRPRVLSQSTPRTKSTPARSMTRRSTEKE